MSDQEKTPAFIGLDSFALFLGCCVGWRLSLEEVDSNGLLNDHRDRLLHSSPPGNYSDSKHVCFRNTIIRSESDASVLI